MHFKKQICNSTYHQRTMGKGTNSGNTSFQVVKNNSFSEKSQETNNALGQQLNV